MKQMGELYTLQEVADMLKVTRQTVYNWRTAGHLRAAKLAGLRGYRVSAEDLQAFLDSAYNTSGTNNC